MRFLAFLFLVKVLSEVNFMCDMMPECLVECSSSSCKNDCIADCQCNTQCRCSSNADCMDTQFCGEMAVSQVFNLENSVVNVCLPYSLEGQSCGGFTSVPQQCGPGLRCVFGNPDMMDVPGTCQPLQVCAANSDCSSASYCTASLTCAEMGSCLTSDDCSNPANSFISVKCLGTTYCTDSHQCAVDCNGGVSEPVINACSEDSDCPRGSACVEGSCSSLAPASAMCDDFTYCPCGSACVDGLCTQLEARACTSNDDCDGMYGNCGADGFCAPAILPTECPVEDSCEDLDFDLPSMLCSDGSYSTPVCVKSMHGLWKHRHGQGSGHHGHGGRNSYRNSWRGREHHSKMNDLAADGSVDSVPLVGGIRHHGGRHLTDHHHSNNRHHQRSSNNEAEEGDNGDETPDVVLDPSEQIPQPPVDGTPDVVLDPSEQNPQPPVDGTPDVVLDPSEQNPQPPVDGAPDVVLDPSEQDGSGPDVVLDPMEQDGSGASDGNGDMNAGGPRNDMPPRRGHHHQHGKCRWRSTCPNMPMRCADGQIRSPCDTVTTEPVEPTTSHHSDSSFFHNLFYDPEKPLVLAFWITLSLMVIAMVAYCLYRRKRAHTAAMNFLRVAERDAAVANFGQYEPPSPFGVKVEGTAGNQMNQHLIHNASSEYEVVVQGRPYYYNRDEVVA